MLRGNFAPDITGCVFSHLTVIERVENSTQEASRWRCLCECGNEIIAEGRKLRNGAATSCGCIARKKNIEYHTTHNDSNSRLHRIWRGIRTRCLNPYSTGYKNWGGRGISICKEWKDSYESFKRWALQNGYQEDLSIDRINNDGNYEPDNCRWATAKQQANNRRNNISKEI